MRASASEPTCPGSRKRAGVRRPFDIGSPGILGSPPPSVPFPDATNAPSPAVHCRFGACGRVKEAGRASRRSTERRPVSPDGDGLRVGILRVAGYDTGIQPSDPEAHRPSNADGCRSWCGPGYALGARCREGNESAREGGTPPAVRHTAAVRAARCPLAVALLASGRPYPFPSVSGGSSSTRIVSLRRASIPRRSRSESA